MAASLSDTACKRCWHYTSVSYQEYPGAKTWTDEICELNHCVGDYPDCGAFEDCEKVLAEMEAGSRDD